MKVIDLHWVHKDGKYLFTDESAKDEVIIIQEDIPDGKENYKEQEKKKTHFFLCPPIPGPHKKLRIIKGVLQFSTGWGNLRIHGKNIKSNKDVVERQFVSTKSDYDYTETIAFDTLDEVYEYLDSRDDKGDLEDKPFKKVYCISVSHVYHQYIIRRDIWKTYWRTEIYPKKFLNRNEALQEFSRLMGQVPSKFENDDVTYERVNDNTVIMRYKNSKNFRTLSYSISEFTIDAEVDITAY